MKQGLLGELKAQLILTWLGYEISKPLEIHVPYDLLAVKDGKVFKVQVKTSAHNPNPNNPDRFEVNLTTKGGNTKVNTLKKPENNEFDLLFAMVDNGRCWLIPYDSITSKTLVMVGTDHYACFEVKHP